MEEQSKERMPRTPRDFAFDMADRMQKAREVAGYSTAEMARVLDISRATVSNYENRHTAPQPGHRRRWALACGVPDQWLTRGVWPDRWDEGATFDTAAGARSSTDRASDYGSLVRQIRPVDEAAA